MTPNRKEISDALIEAMNKEDMHSREVGLRLNMNPIYVSMARNPKMWDSMSKAAWSRLEEWLYTRGPISLFEIPAGEETWKPKEKTSKAEPGKPVAVKEPEEHSPEAIFKNLSEQEAAFVNEIKPIIQKVGKRLAKKEKNGKSVKLVINKAEMEALQAKVEFLENEVLKQLTNSVTQVAELRNKFDELDKERDRVYASLPDMIDASLRNHISISHGDKKAKESSGIVLFQKNIFKS
jgi:hypothetical protein